MSPTAIEQVHVVTNTGLSVTGTTLNEDTFSPSRVESFSSKHRRRVARNWGRFEAIKGTSWNSPRYMEESCLCERQGSGSVPVAANHTSLALLVRCRGEKSIGFAHTNPR